MSTYQFNTLSAIADVSSGRGSKGLRSTTAYKTFRAGTLSSLFDKGFLKAVSYRFRGGAQHWFVRLTTAGFRALA
jgi:hypothetical protein